jgi:hypothetical protein
LLVVWQHFRKVLDLLGQPDSLLPHLGSFKVFQIS